MSKKSSPKAPDPIATANAQAQANKDAVTESAKVNAVDQTTPYGTVRYRRNADGTPAEVISELTPLQQKALDQQNQLATILGGSAINQSQFLPQDKFSLASLGTSPANKDYSAASKAAQDAVYNKAMGLLNPQFATENRTMEQSIANRGLPVAGEAAQLLRDQAGARQNTAREQAAFSAIQAGNAEQGRLFGQDMSARQQGVSELLTERNQPYQELAAYLQGTPMQTAPQAQLPTYQVAPTDIAGNIYNNYNAQNQRYQNNLNGMYQLAGTAAMAAAMSDRRLKTNIKPLGKRGKHNWYSFNYVWGGPAQEGVMAQEVLAIKPDAVMLHPSGYMMVDYANL